VVTEIAKKFTRRRQRRWGTRGHVKSDDGLIDVDLRRPVEMGGPGGATNPEELSPLHSACFTKGMGIVAKKERRHHRESTDGSGHSGTLGRSADYWRRNGMHI